MKEKMDKLIDKFAAYFEAEGEKEVSRSIQIDKVMYNGKERELITGELILECPVHEDERAGNWGITRKLKKIEIRPQLSKYTCWYKDERKSGSDRNFNSPHALCHDVLVAISNM